MVLGPGVRRGGEVLPVDDRKGCETSARRTKKRKQKLNTPQVLVSRIDREAWR